MWDEELFKKTMKFAGKAHGDQKVPGSETSYLAHIADVCMETMAAILKSENGDFLVALETEVL